MSNQKLKSVIFAFITFTFVMSCTSKKASFEEAISKARKSKISQIPEIHSGLPYFLVNTLTPVWSPKTDQKIVSIPNINLLDQDGNAFTQDRFLSKTSIVAFIFTSCAGYCPLLISKLKKIENEIKDPKDVQFVVFSVDPEIDIPKVLKIYAKKHNIPTDKNWIFVTGDKNSIYSLVKKTFASEVRKLEASNMRKFAHTEHFYLMDHQARLRSILNGTKITLAKSASTTIEIMQGELKLLSL